MNLTARIRQKCYKTRNSNYKPNYILNVNINIPIRSSQLVSDRPVSGEFAFSPNQLKKKFKLEIPSARTTYECDSRKISYLGDTINTISHRINTRKGLTKSAQPSILNSQLKNINRKCKNQYRSEATSPVRKKTGNKWANSKFATSNKNITNKQFINELMNESEDNIIGYTNQSSQALKLGKNSLKKLQQKPQKLCHTQLLQTLNLKPQSPMLEQPNMIQQIREFERSAQFRKQHLNYIYLKQKVLVLASVKKIQRAWRNYKTKKLIKSYSNNISLKFSGKIKNQFQTRQPQQIKILTVRSCGYQGRSSEMRREVKKNLSQLTEKIDGGDLDKGRQWKIEEKSIQEQLQKKSDGKRQKRNTQKSAIVKFQLQQINKWQELIKDIREGKNVEEVLQKSFKRKEELEKQISHNLQQIHQKDLSNGQYKKNGEFYPNENNMNNIDIKDELELFKLNINSISSENSLYEKLEFIRFKNSYHMEENLQSDNYGENVMEECEGEVDAEKEKKKKRKLEFFQNQIRKIDNQESQHNLFEGCHSYAEMIQINEQNKDNIGRGTEQQQNIKLKRKLQVINKGQLLNYLSNFNQFDNIETNNQPNSHQLQPQQQQQNPPPQLPQPTQPIFLNKPQSKFPKTKDDLLDQKRDTNRNQKDLQDYNEFCFNDEWEERLEKFRKNKISGKDKEEIAGRVEEELFYDLLLDLSEKEGFISKIQALYAVNKQNNVPHPVFQKSGQEIKPEGICTNLQSIKDYLQNFVAFAFEQQPVKVVNGFNCPSGPSTKNILKYLNKNEKREETNFYVPVLALELFNLHWLYASEQIYFDAKYPNDPVKEEQRVRHLKSITKTYFRAIFDGFNECLQPFRLYGQVGKAFPWSNRQKKLIQPMLLIQIKPLVRLAYKKLSQLSILNCGQLFEDKRHNLTQNMIEQIQQQKMNVLIEIELQDCQMKWNTKEIEESQVLWKIYQDVQWMLIMEVCIEMQKINTGQ